MGKGIAGDPTNIGNQGMLLELLEVALSSGAIAVQGRDNGGSSTALQHIQTIEGMWISSVPSKGSTTSVQGPATLQIASDGSSATITMRKTTAVKAQLLVAGY